MESKHSRRSCILITVGTVLMLILFVAAGLTAYFVGGNFSLFGSPDRKEPDTTKPSNDSTEQHVVIIGAGISGISAAKTLHEAGIPFLILEAGSKIGGRIREHNFSGTVVSNGACWIHGLTGNPVKQIADKINLKGKLTNFGDYTCLNATGSNVTAALDEAYDRFSPIIDKIKATGSKARKNANTIDMSQRSALTKNGWYKTTDVETVLEFYELDYEYGSPAERSSAKYATDIYTYHDFGEDQLYVTDPRGIAEIVRYLASQFLTKDDKRLKLGETVATVQYHQNGVSVKTNKGVYNGSFVLSTVSLGVLQHDIIKFDPPFPDWKRIAIHKHLLGDGVHIHLKFKNPFWHGTEHTLLANLRHGFYPYFMNLQATGKFPAGTNVIFMSVLAQEARRISRLPDRIIKHEVMTVFRNIYGNSIEDPIDFMVTKWSSDPRFFGAWCNWPAGLSKDEFNAAKAPLGRLYFGGEATSEKYFGFMHGAYLSGIEQANKILKCIKGNCESYVPSFNWPK